MKFKTPLVATACLVIGIAAGLFANDFVAETGYPYALYSVQLKQEQIPTADFDCMRIGSVYGKNMSNFDPAVGRQADCTLVVVGELNPDGSFNAYMHWDTWYGRWLSIGHPFVWPAERVKSAEKAGESFSKIVNAP